MGAFYFSRRQLLTATFGLAASSLFEAQAAPGYVALEKQYGAKLGLWALDTGSGKQVAHRADERFAMCSTFKTLAVAALLARSSAAQMEQPVFITESDLLDYAPVTRPARGSSLTWTQLCDAAIRYSDNTAANLILRELDGPAEVTRFVRSLGDKITRLDRVEPELNAAEPGSLLDTSTPRALGQTYRRLALGSALSPEKRQQLVAWLRGNTTSALPKPSRIRAAVPAGCTVGDKTGSGDYGAANDVGVIWPPRRAPLVLAVLTRRGVRSDEIRPDLIREAAALALRLLQR